MREQIGLTDEQIASISQGKAFIKVLPSKTPAEIFMFGAVYVNATPDAFVKFALDISRMKRMPGYLAVGKFSNAPSLAELEGFSLEPDDIKALRYCKPGRCGVQLPASAMDDLHKSLDWSKPDVGHQANERLRMMALDILRRYQETGNSSLSYHDQIELFDVSSQLRSLLGRSGALPMYLPDLSRILLDYPHTKMSEVESRFSWERVAFGMKPTLRLNHAIAYQSAGPRGTAHVVAVKQLYASHYFQLALDLAVCVTESGRSTDKGFYLITLKGSAQQGLTGFTGSILRRIIVSKTRYVQEGLLMDLKKALEAQH